MSATSNNISRVSNSLTTYATLSRLRQNSLRLFREQERLSSGQQLLSASDDPIAAEMIGRLTQSRAAQDQILSNLRHADGYLSASDSAVTDIGSILSDAARIASEQSSSLQSAEERASQAVVLDGLIDQLRNVGNRQFQGLYLFGGRRVDQAPLTSDLGRITYAGDAGSRETLVGSTLTQAYDVSAANVFGLQDSLNGGYVDFDVQLSTSSRVSELGGATGAGVRLGHIQVAQTGPALNFEVDFTGAETVGDLINRFNAAAANAGSTLTLGINPADGGSLQISPALASVQITEINNGTIASDLGIRKTATGVTLDGDTVNRRVSLTTNLSDLQPGGVTLPNGIVITNGSKSATVTFTGATTVQDVLNRLNTSGLGIRASIEPNGEGIVIENQVGGTPLIIGENGGTDADTLGIKTIDGSLSLTRVNDGRGIHPVTTGADVRITNANGVSFDVSFTGAKTIGDVITAINAASTLAGAGVTAQTSQGGAGLHLTGPAGAGQLSVQAQNLSPVAQELGIAKTGTATDLDGDNVTPFYQSGIFTALYRLRDGLLADSSSEITEAGSAINAIQKDVAGTAGEVGARSKSMRDRLAQTEDAVAATTILLSEIKDVDYTDAVTKFQQAQTALQASLLTTSRIQNLSLLDFLG
ncbi:MAG: flagellin [Planctomycetota bacterium]